MDKLWDTFGIWRIKFSDLFFNWGSEIISISLRIKYKLNTDLPVKKVGFSDSYSSQYFFRCFCKKNLERFGKFRVKYKLCDISGIWWAIFTEFIPIRWSNIPSFLGEKYKCKFNIIKSGLYWKRRTMRRFG